MRENVEKPKEKLTMKWKREKNKKMMRRKAKKLRSYLKQNGNKTKPNPVIENLINRNLAKRKRDLEEDGIKNSES